jgi:thioredoxin reductase (NADPH)
MITLIPNSWGSKPLREFNKCHEPGGSPKGGQFTSAKAGGCGGGVVSSKAVAAYKELKAEWARVNNQLLDYVDDPHRPEVDGLCKKCKDIVKKMYDLDLDPGGLEGIGLPGGPRDIVIVGAGPGGLTAAVMGGTDGLDTLFIDAQATPGGQAKHSSRIENYPGFPIGTSGENLTKRLHLQAERVGAEGKLGVTVTGIEVDEKTGMKTITLDTGEQIEARAVILAGGIATNSFAFPGSDTERAIFNDGQQLQREGAGQPVVVIGGANSAAQAALGAARSASHVTVISRSPIEKGMSDYQVQALNAHPRIKVITGDEIAGIDKDGRLTTKKGTTLTAHRVGVFVGGSPNTKWLPPTIKLDKGKIVVNGNLETSVPGIFAVGDIRQGSIGRIGTSVGDGQVAVRNVWDYFSRVGA